MHYFQGMHLSRYIAVVFLVVSTVMVGWTDPQFNPMGYRWVVIHILSVGKNYFKELT